MAKKTTAALVVVLLGLVTACGPPAPTPTRAPSPLPSPVWILASEPEHLEGIWFIDMYQRDHYFRWDVEGTMWKTSDAKDNTPEILGRFWFEEDAYSEERTGIPGIGVYEAQLQIQGGRAVRLRMKVIEEPRDFGDAPLPYGPVPFVRVD